MSGNHKNRVVSSSLRVLKAESLDQALVNDQLGLRMSWSDKITLAISALKHYKLADAAVLTGRKSSVKTLTDFIRLIRCSTKDVCLRSATL